MLLVVEFSGKVNIITGPNYSGKSIYVKQVGGVSVLPFYDILVSNYCSNMLNTFLGCFNSFSFSHWKFCAR